MELGKDPEKKHTGRKCERPNKIIRASNVHRLLGKIWTERREYKEKSDQHRIEQARLSEYRT